LGPSTIAEDVEALIALAMTLSGRTSFRGQSSSGKAPKRAYQRAALSSFASMASASPS